MSNHPPTQARHRYEAARADCQKVIPATSATGQISAAAPATCGCRPPPKPPPPENPPGTGKGKKEKAFVHDVLRDKLLCVTLINGVVVYGRIIFWDLYTFGLTPDGDGMPMLVHKQHLATIQPVREEPAAEH